MGYLVGLKRTRRLLHKMGIKALYHKPIFIHCTRQICRKRSLGEKISVWYIEKLTQVASMVLPSSTTTRAQYFLGSHLYQEYSANAIINRLKNPLGYEHLTNTPQPQSSTSFSPLQQPQPTQETLQINHQSATSDLIGGSLEVFDLPTTDGDDPEEDMSRRRIEQEHKKKKAEEFDFLINHIIGDYVLSLHIVYKYLEWKITQDMSLIRH